MIFFPFGIMQWQVLYYDLCVVFVLIALVGAALYHVPITKLLAYPSLDTSLTTTQLLIASMLL
jgi:hypothetical protein